MDVAVPGPLVDGDWLHERLAAVAAGDLVVADVRWYLDGRSGRAAYDAGHLPGARWIDLDADLAEAPGPVVGRHPLPTSERFAVAMRHLGVGPDTPVVAYDDQSGAIAARLWWLLDVVGHPAAVLDGGLAAWPGALTRDDPGPGRGTFTARPWPVGAVADADTVARLAVTGTGGAVVVDARAHARYTGADTAIDPRAGHVPGARNVPWTDLVDPGSGCMLDPDALARRFADAGIGAGTPVVAYCGSGVTACFDLLALRRIGVDDTRLYPASWSGWSTDPERPVATGDER